MNQPDEVAPQVQQQIQQRKSMRLRIFLPSHIFIDTRVEKVLAEAENGAFCLLPRHIDMATALAPGLLSYVKIDSPTDGALDQDEDDQLPGHTEDGQKADREEFVAIDEGILVKRGEDILVSVRHALRGPDLGKLRQAVAEQFRQLDERERLARSALAHMEADFVRRFVSLKE